MKYKVKTNALADVNKGDIIETAKDGMIHDNEYLPFDRLFIERNPEWFEPVEEEFKEGQYYRDEIGQVGRIMCVNETSCDVLNIETDEYTSVPKGRLKSFIKLNNNQIENALIKEAKRRGYRMDNFKCLIKHTGPSLILDKYDYDYKEDVLFLGQNSCYVEGKWAEIIDEPITINGHEVEFEDTHIKVGCRTVPYGDISHLSSFARRNGLSIHREGEDITEAIHKIAERL